MHYITQFKNIKMMKKNYFLLVAFFMAILSFGQGPIITMISDGDCTGGNPKVLEIYANGTVDFSQYSLENQTNGNTTWGATFDLTDLGTITDSFVYLYYESSSGTGTFISEYGSAGSSILTSSVLSVNGDDRVRIIETASGTVIDQYGVSDTDGSGTVWEYKDGYGKRTGGNANGGAFNPANWTFNNGGINGQGTCQGGATFESIIGLGTYTVPTGTASPTLAITSPADAATVLTGDVNVTLAVSNFDVGAADGTHDGHIHYTVDGGSTVMKFDTTPIALTGLAAGAHTVAVELVDDSHNPLTTPVTATVTFTVQAYTQVSDIATLRAGTVGEYYEFTGEALITFAQSHRNQKFIQDATGAILVDDASGNITSGARDNGISGIKGKLSAYRGMLQFQPTMDATVTPGSSVTITPELISLSDIGEAYEAKLVVLENVTIADAATGDGNFYEGTLYEMTRGTATGNFVTSFYDADYVAATPADVTPGTGIPTVAKDIVGIITEKSGATGYGHGFTARDTADFSTASIQENNIAGLAVYPNPSNGVLNIRTESNAVKNITIYNVLGAKVFQTTTAATQVNLPNINNGIYLLNIEENNQTATIKLMIK